jgi:DNA-binding cell septation regulator SpoVG
MAAPNAAVAAGLKKRKPYRSGALLGFWSVQLPSDLILHDIRLMSGRNGAWCALPAQKLINRDGRPRLDANNKPIYSQIVEFVDRPTRDRFNGLILDLIRREHPEVFGEVGR